MMANGKWKKRKMKMKGAFNRLVSLLTLRYTSWNTRRLRKAFRELPLDRLHVGCGEVVLKDWINVKFEKREIYGQIIRTNGTVLLNYNLLKPWPWEDESIRFLAGSHFIEHLDMNNGIRFLKEAFRVMKKDGVIRLSCPDLELYATNYVKRNQAFFGHEKIREWCAYEQARTPGEIFIAKAYDSGCSHRWFYDLESLKHILELSGFKDVRKCSRLEGKIPQLEEIELAERELETLYVEARKP